MNIEDVKQISIADYLHSLGYSPVKRQGNGLWYKSPLREEHEASFKVNTDRNLWYDFGAGKGGNIIALAKELYFSDSLPYLLKRIEEQTPNVRPISFSFSQCRTYFGNIEVSKLAFSALEVNITLIVFEKAEWAKFSSCHCDLFITESEYLIRFYS